MASWELVAVGGGVGGSSGNATPSEPTGAAQGDLLVAVISYRDTATFTAPAGWTIVEQESSGNTDVDVSTSIASGLIAYIIRGASAPSYTFTRTGGDVYLSRVVAYRPVGGTITFDESNSATLGSASTTVSMTGFTTNAADSLIVVGSCGASNSTASAFVAATDPSTGSGVTTSTSPGAIATGTWRRRNSSGSTNGADTNLSIADAVRATAGATGDIQYTAASSRRHAIVGAAFTLTPSGVTLTADAGSFALTGVAAGLALTRTIASDAGALTLTGNATGLTASRVLAASAGAFTHTGVAAGLSRVQLLTADAGAFTLTGVAAGLTVSRRLVADAGSFALTGVAAGLGRIQILTAAGGSFTLAGANTGLMLTRALPASVGTFTRTGISASLTASRVLTASGGSFARTGNDAAFSRIQILTADAGAFALTGSATGLGLTRLLVASAGSFTHTGVAAGTRASRLLTASGGSFTHTGNSAALVPSGQNFLIASAGTFALASIDAGLKISRVLTASAGAFALVGPSVSMVAPSDDPAATFTALGTAAPTLVHLVTIDALGIRWTDGGFVSWSGNLYASEDSTYGWLGGIGAIEDGADGQATVCDLTIICDETALALWVDPTVQGSIVTVHLGTLDRDTGRLIGGPDLLFRGELDQPRLSAGAGLTLIFDCITEEARMLEPNEEQRMTDSFHQSVWPGDLGCEHISDVEKKIYWRANDPNNAIS